MFAKEIEKTVLDFVKPFGIKKVKYSDEFLYKPKKKEIHFSIFPYLCDGDIEFVEFLNNFYGVDIKKYYYVFSLMHEVGHHLTSENVYTSDDDIAFDFFMRLGVCQMEDDNQLYFLLPAEKAANEWAINFIENNLDLCWDFEQKYDALMEKMWKNKRFIKWKNKILDKYEVK